MQRSATFAGLITSARGCVVSDRLTIERARPGMRVVCVDDKRGRWKLRAGDEYVISAVHERANWVEVEGSRYVHEVAQFIPAPALTPGLIEALREWHRARSPWVHYASESGRNLYAAIEAAGILDKPARTTGREATISEGWWA